MTGKLRRPSFRLPPIISASGPGIAQASLGLAPIGRAIQQLASKSRYRAANHVEDPDHRPHYAYCVQQSARLAKRLGYPRISVIEFGVAGGQGLITLEHLCSAISRRLGIEIEVYGFDTGTGLPEPKDYRDLPYHWRPGFYAMDIPALRARLSYAQLVLGNLSDTAGAFFAEFSPAPIGAAIFDLDFYSSTVDALKLFEGPRGSRLPRVFCYFDDIIGGDIELYNDFTGERLAIAEFNAGHERIKLSPAYHLIAVPPVAEWHHQIYILHDFQHPDYGTFVSDPDQQLPLRHRPGRRPRPEISGRTP